MTVVDGGMHPTPDSSELASSVLVESGSSDLACFKHGLSLVPKHRFLQPC